MHQFLTLMHIPLGVHASVFNTDGQVRNILSDMEPIDTGNQVRNTLSSDVETIDMEYLLEDNQRVVNFLAAGTQEDTQRFIDLLKANENGHFALVEIQVPAWVLQRDISEVQRGKSDMSKLTSVKKINYIYN